MKTNNNTLKLVLVFLIFSVCFTNCKKDIDIPATELENLFGSWDWVQTSGGIAGGTITPATEGYTKKVEFSRNGIYNEFQDGILLGKRKFTISETKSIYTGEDVYIINYEKAPFFKQDNLYLFSHTVTFYGLDTIILDDEMDDGFIFTYVKK